MYRIKRVGTAWVVCAGEVDLMIFQLEELAVQTIRDAERGVVNERRIRSMNRRPPSHV